MNQDIKLAILDSTRNSVKRSLEGLNVRQLKLEDDFIKALIDNSIEALILDIANLDDFFTTVREIRANSKTYLLPIFCVSDSNIAYADASFSSLEEVSQLVLEINKQCDGLAFDAKDGKRITRDWQLRMLTYLYTRRSFKALDVFKNKKSKSFYSYPIIDVFCDKFANYSEWLQELKSSGVLRVKNFVKAYFCCNNCMSAHALFSERCPDCKSENITLADFLHCYTCGNIAPENEFLRNEQYVCNQCKTVLRHIGHDYDRPLESYSCNDCGSSFIDSEVITTCIDCDTTTKTERMRRSTIFNYELTEKAEHFISQNLDYIMSIFDNINYVSPEFFYSMLEWAAAMKQREKAYDFSLLRIKILDHISVTDVGILAKSLKEVLRRTDMLTRPTNQLIWVWLPNTPLSGAEVVIKKLKKIQNSEGMHIDESMTIKAFDSKGSEDYKSARSLLAELVNRE